MTEDLSKNRKSKKKRAVMQPGEKKVQRDSYTLAMVVIILISLTAKVFMRLPFDIVLLSQVYADGSDSS
jgi:hypothetical protein